MRTFLLTVLVLLVFYRCNAAPSSLKAKRASKTLPEVTKDCEESGDCEVIGDVVIMKGDVGAQSGVTGYSWPDGVVPYVIEDSSSSDGGFLDLIKKAAEDLSNKTCVTVRPKQEGDTDTFTVYLTDGEFKCYTSPLGYWGESANHEMHLTTGCFDLGYGTTMHEFIHALGFFHEQARDDRDDYIRINWENISPDWVSQYDKASKRGLDISYFGVKYNYESIMHYYLGDAMTALNNPDALGDVNQIGQRDHLSEGDIAMINGKYADTTKCQKKKK